MRATAVKAAATMRTASEAGSSSGRVASLFSAVVVITECTCARITLASRIAIPSSRTRVLSGSVGKCTCSVVLVAAFARSSVRGSVPIRVSGSRSVVPIVATPVVVGCAPRVVPVVVVFYPTMVPITSPMMPAPSVAPVESDFESNSELDVRSRIPNSRIRIPSWPGHNHRKPIHNPGIVSWYVNDFRIGGLNHDRFALGLYDLLLCCLQIAGLFGFFAHDLYGGHHVCFLVVVGVSQS